MTKGEWLTSTDPMALLRFLHKLKSNTRPAEIIWPYTPTPRKLRLFACACCRQPEVWDGVPCLQCKDGNIWTPRSEFAHIKGPVKCSACHGTGFVGGLTDPRSRHAVEVAERYADGEATADELAVAWGAANYANRPDQGGYTRISVVAATSAARDTDLAKTLPTWLEYKSATQAALLRCIFGNPWRPVTLPRTMPGLACSGALGWLTPAVVALARSVYDDRRFEEMGILADALEEAGCTGADLLRHLRDGDAPCHACEGRGCVEVDRFPADDGDRLYVPTRKEDCPRCHGTGRVPAVHARGCWVLDLILEKE